jgi:opacity protein-like surface antigen
MDDVLTPNTFLTAGQSWIRSVSPRTNLTLGASTGWFNADGVETTDQVSERATDQVSESVTLQVQTELSERLSFTAGGGGNVVRTSGSTDETTSGFIGDVALGYALANTTLSAFAAHNLAPSSLGSLQERTTAGFSVGHQINEASSVSFSGAFVYQLPVVSTPVDADRDQQHQALVLTVGYNRNLAQNWNLGLSYTFTQQNNNDDEFFWELNEGSSTSNAVFATITRNFSLMR